eukprot:Protomagalhaensia_wolfi_Nauph_80__1412@NODE_1846_length_1311_cov_105_986635_g1443_i0_p1_GENE_NODE_1846_length_1311_cov_105_986635_g1443_i0NODE_1846_length_1311_cov_105_986635_g1443_i0_p1_ORF_typecomplete_len133_score16_77_NODE_1846_length_1311_cov_105_986635_g1443_i095493
MQDSHSICPSFLPLLKQRLFSTIGVLVKNVLDLKRLSQVGPVVVALDATRTRPHGPPSEAFFGVKLFGEIRTIQAEPTAAENLLRVASVVATATSGLPSILSIQNCEPLGNRGPNSHGQTRRPHSFSSLPIN